MVSPPSSLIQRFFTCRHAGSAPYDHSRYVHGDPSKGAKSGQYTQDRPSWGSLPGSGRLNRDYVPWDRRRSDVEAQSPQLLAARRPIDERSFRDAIVKLRVVARNQQLIRLDFEDAPTHEVLNGVKNRFRELLAECDVVILSDYGKGGLTHVVSFIEWARQAGKPVLIDPKGDDYAKYTGATLLTPNRAELRQVTGSWKNEADLQEKARALRRNLDLQALLLTRSEEGMTLFRDGEPHHQPTQAREVFDVSGAGDTVIAGMGLAMAAGLDFPEAMQLANAAAGVVVGKLGTAVCSFDELAQSL